MEATMLPNPTLQQLRQMRLHGMADALEEQRRTTAVHALDFEERLAFLVEREVTSRDNRRMERLLKQAKLRLPASVEDLDFRASRGLDRSLLFRLAGCDWIRTCRNIIITGPQRALFPPQSPLG
jgi:DNA replication protein DnaC